MKHHGAKMALICMILEHNYSQEDSRDTKLASEPLSIRKIARYYMHFTTKEAKGYVKGETLSPLFLASPSKLTELTWNPRQKSGTQAEHPGQIRAASTGAVGHPPVDALARSDWSRCPSLHRKKRDDNNDNGEASIS